MVASGCSVLFLAATAALVRLAYSQGAVSSQPAMPMLSCASQMDACLAATGVAEFGELHKFMSSAAEIAREPWRRAQDDVLDMEKNALALLRDTGLQVLAATLEAYISCTSTVGGSCDDSLAKLSGMGSLKEQMEVNMRQLVQNYVAGPGLRSPILRAGTNIKADFDKYALEIAEASQTSFILGSAMELVHQIGRRCRLLTHILGMHSWVRSLVVPGRGVPAFILHEEYTTWEQMLRTLVGNMVRGGQASVSLVDVGVSAEQDPSELLREFPSLQYIGGFRSLAAIGEDVALRLEQRLGFAGNRAVIRPADTLASALPAQALDIIVISDAFDHPSVASDMLVWEQRVKPGGVLAGIGFAPSSLAAVSAVCRHRHGNDIHIGLGGTFWWYVEPEEE